jgi:hypothetical protein
MGITMRVNKVFIIIIIIFLVVGIILYYPVKIAKNKDILTNNDNYIICEIVMTTGFDWRIEKSSIGKVGLVFIEGISTNLIKELSYSIIWGNNEFIMWGNFLSNKNYDGGSYPVFEVTKWEILFPVKRETIVPSFLTPKYGLTFFDYKG